LIERRYLKMTEEDEKKAQEEAEGEKTQADAKKSEDEAKAAETEKAGGTEGENPIIKAEKVLEEIKKENDRKESLIKRDEDLTAKKMLGGVTQAGQEPAKKVETPKEYKDRVMSGKL